jgi:nicotinamidase-related amidase
MSQPQGDGEQANGGVMMETRYAGVSNLLDPENCRMILIDHQPLQFAGVQNIDGTLLVNNVVGLAKTAKVFGVPTILTTVLEERGGHLVKEVQDVFPEQKPINRTTLNTWEDERVVNAVRKIGRKKLVIAALWTEICLAYPVLSALGEDYEEFIVTDASGGVSVDAHERAVQRMVQAGAVPLTWIGFGSELQRDWAREKTIAGIGEIMSRHGGNIGTSLAWEFQLLASNPQKASA